MSLGSLVFYVSATVAYGLFATAVIVTVPAVWAYHRRKPEPVEIGQERK